MCGHKHGGSSDMNLAVLRATALLSSAFIAKQFMHIFIVHEQSEYEWAAMSEAKEWSFVVFFGISQ